MTERERRGRGGGHGAHQKDGSGRPCLCCTPAGMRAAPPSRSGRVRRRVDQGERRSLDGGTLRLMPDGGVRAAPGPRADYYRVPAAALSARQRARLGERDALRHRGEAGRRPPRETGFLMLQALLVERFRLAFHRESREVDGFALVRARADRLGPDLRVSDVDCEKAFATTPRCRQGGITEDTLIRRRRADVEPASAGDLESWCAGERRDGLDRHLRHRSCGGRTRSRRVDDRPSIYTALQEQLGLKLERRRVTTEVLVVDRLERHPTPELRRSSDEPIT